MKTQIVEQIELFSEAELESLEFVPEELEAIEAERVPDLDSISFEDIAEDLVAALELTPQEAKSRAMLDQNYTNINTVLVQVTQLLRHLRNNQPNDPRIPELRMRATHLGAERERILNYYKTLPQLPPLRMGSPIRVRFPSPPLRTLLRPALPRRWSWPL